MNQPSLFETDRGIKAIIREPKSLPDDITRNRHKGNKFSEEANKKVDKVRDRQRVIEAFRALGGKSYSKAIANFMNRPLNAISGRLSDLKAAGVLIGTGERAEGCEVLQLLEAK